MAKKRIDKKILSITSIVISLFIAFNLIIKNRDNAFKDAGLIQTTVSDKMQVSFIDVGQGSCTLITFKGTVILVDGGEASKEEFVTDYLKNKGISKIDCLIATHPHTDHIGSLPRVLDLFDVKELFMPKIPKSIIPTTSTYEKFLIAADKNANKITAVKADDEFNFGEIKVQILSPSKEYDDLNSLSVVAKITYGLTSMIVSGDATADTEKDIINSGFDCTAQLITVSHHGSKSSTTDKWLYAVKPQYAVISCGKDNDYGHPHKATIKRLEKHGVEFYRTDLIGTVVFESDGKTFSKCDKNK